MLTQAPCVSSVLAAGTTATVLFRYPFNPSDRDNYVGFRILKLDKNIMGMDMDMTY